ncbi:hypothetical protein L484_000015 [Morus notabilis]|uniref:Wound-responsive family protein n=1 Tax=Morus notabilis TaxID=981085 RepID=W9SDY6_9ROSA|nr:hypothetical protein L484_000015 [Morus notabilis]
MSNSAWIVATSIGAVEALKDQGVCRWNGVFRALQQCAKNNIGSFCNAHAMKISAAAASSSSTSTNNVSKKIGNRSKEEVQRKVMELNCWGPSTIKF